MFYFFYRFYNLGLLLLSVLGEANGILWDGTNSLHPMVGPINWDQLTGTSSRWDQFTCIPLRPTEPSRTLDTGKANRATFHTLSKEHMTESHADAHSQSESHGVTVQCPSPVELGYKLQQNEMIVRAVLSGGWMSHLLTGFFRAREKGRSPTSTSSLIFTH